MANAAQQWLLSGVTGPAGVVVTDTLHEAPGGHRLLPVCARPEYQAGGERVPGMLISHLFLGLGLPGEHSKVVEIRLT